MKKMLFLTVVALVLMGNLSIFAMAPKPVNIQHGPGPAMHKNGSGTSLGSLPPAPQSGFYDLTSVEFKNLKPADKNFEVLKELYDIALNLQETMAALKIKQFGGAAQTLKVADIQPLLLDIEAAIADLAPAIMTLKGTLLTLKPQDVNDFKRINKKALDLKPADAALKLSTPAITIETPGQKALEQKRMQALKDARNTLHSIILP